MYAGVLFLLLPSLFIMWWWYWLYKNISHFSRERQVYLNEDGEWCMIRKVHALVSPEREEPGDSKWICIADVQAQIYSTARIWHGEMGVGTVTKANHGPDNAEPYTVEYAKQKPRSPPPQKKSPLVHYVAPHGVQARR